MSTLNIRAWVSTGAAGAWHPPKFWTSPLAPADFEVLNTNWHPQSSFYVISGTPSFKFLTQALMYSVFGIGFFREIMVNSSILFLNSSFWVRLKLCSGSLTLLLLLPCSSHKLSLIYIYEFEKSRFSETCLDDSRGLADNFIDSFICFSTTAYLLLGIDRGTLHILKTVRSNR